MTSGKKLAVFDMDGTLYRSHESVVASTNRALKDFGLPEKPPEFLSSLIGEKMADYCRIVAPELEAAKLNEFAALVNKYDTGWLHEKGSLYPGALESLAALESDGFLLAICTHAGMDYAGIVLKSFGIIEKFDFIKTRDDGSSKTEQVAGLIGETGAEFAAMIGDREYDRQAAAENFIPFIWAKYGYGEFEVKDAHFIAVSAGEIAEIMLNPAFQAAAGLYSPVNLERVKAGKKLKRLGTRASVAFKPVYAALWDESDDTRLEAADVLGCIGKPAAEAVPKLAEMTRDPAMMVRAAAAEALGKIASLPELTVPAFIECLKSEDRPVKVAALWGLKQFGAESMPALSALIECLGDDDRMVVRRALRAIAAIGAKSPDAALAVEKVKIEFGNEKTDGAAGKMMADAIASALGAVSGE